MKQSGGCPEIGGGVTCICKENEKVSRDGPDVCRAGKSTKRRDDRESLWDEWDAWDEAGLRIPDTVQEVPAPFLNAEGTALTIYGETAHPWGTLVLEDSELVFISDEMNPFDGRITMRRAHRVLRGGLTALLQEELGHGGILRGSALRVSQVQDHRPRRVPERRVAEAQ
eukprot:Rhum_TRINITY_DN14813_c3_g1::Rhum_TRINITY_DN14813_c3_g1_i1::g.120460::m.120460